MNDSNRPGGFRGQKQKAMEMNIANEMFVVGWTTKGKRGLAGNMFRYTRRYPEFNEAYRKYLSVSNKERTVYCFLNKRIEYETGAVTIVRIYNGF